jgi:glutamyl-Q tRNA(Asp) synthetase
MEGGNVTTRFAPSPNGELHVGHAYSAVFSERWARARGGRFLLRIEDIDFTRAREAFVEGILRDLKWLGLSWEEPVRRQSRHMEEYRDRLSQLREMGLVYPCFCSRREIHEEVKRRGASWPRDPEGRPLYPGTCRDMDAGERRERLERGEPHAWRLDMAAAAALAERIAGGGLSWREEGAGPAGETGEVRCDPRVWGDVIVGRKDIGVSYHLAVVHDDALQEVTHVTRGQDLFHATAVHRLLQVLFGLPAPVYVHHRLITDADGRKLSKRFRDRSLRSLREEGVSPAALLEALGLPPAQGLVSNNPRGPGG